MPRRTNGRPGQRRNRTRLAHGGQFSPDRIHALLSVNVKPNANDALNAEGQQEPSPLEPRTGDQ
jgi:hypothetical protein